MKLFLLLIFAFIGNFSLAQSASHKTIDNRNYYDYFMDVEGHSINWLRTSDAIPVIIDELLNNGIAYHTIRVGQLLKLNDSTRLVVTIGFNRGDNSYGFVYEDSHRVPINRKDRDLLSDRSKLRYTQSEKDVLHGVNFMGIDSLPDNIFLLKQTWYWFQFDNKGTKYDVSKDIAISILRQDIQDYLKRL